MVTEDEIQGRWEENRQAVQDAKKSVLAAFRFYAQVRARAAASARKRDLRYPVLNARERGDVDRAHEAWTQSKVDLADAQGRFKAGVVEE